MTTMDVIKPEWGPPESRIMLLLPAKRPQTMATFTEAKGWSIYGDVLAKFVSTSAADIMARLRTL